MGRQLDMKPDFQTKIDFLTQKVSELQEISNQKFSSRLETISKTQSELEKLLIENETVLKYMDLKEKMLEVEQYQSVSRIKKEAEES